MFLKQTKSNIYVIFCLFCAAPASTFAMNVHKNSSDIHFYGNQKKNRSDAPKITIDCTRSETDSLTTPIIPIIVLIPPLKDEEPLASTSIDDSQHDSASLDHKKLSHLFYSLKKESMSADERNKSLLMLKDVVHEELINCLQEKSNKDFLFAALETDIVLFLEKTEQKQAECLSLQAQCLTAQPDLEDID